MTGELWYLNKVGMPEDLNKICNVGIYSDISDNTVTPSTIGDAFFSFDIGRIDLSADGETFTHQIPLIVAVPATATSTGAKGQIAIDASGNYIYVCVSDNTWIRALFATF